MGDREAGGRRRASGGSQTGEEARLVGVWERRVGESGHSHMRGELKGFPGARLGPRSAALQERVGLLGDPGLPPRPSTWEGVVPFRLPASLPGVRAPWLLTVCSQRSG